MSQQPRRTRTVTAEPNEGPDPHRRDDRLGPRADAELLVDVIKVDLNPGAIRRLV